MKKCLLVLCAFCSVFVVFADQEKGVERTKKNFQQKRAEVNMRRNGGFLERPGSYQGKILIIDERSKPDVEQLQSVATEFLKYNKFNLQVVSSETGEKCRKLKIKEKGGNVGVFIVEDDITPTLLVAPEDGWAVVNVKALVSGVAKSRLAPRRIQKEVLRALGYVCGGMSTRFETSIAGPVAKPEDLDGKVEMQLPFDVTSTFNSNLAKFGVTPFLQTTYRTACKEGWAPQPTNDFQRVVWEEYHTKPSEPIKIKYDPKKGL